MEREKQIEEMHLDFEKWDDADTESSLAEWMYNLGYRKISDVIKEIYEKLYKQSYPSAFGGWAISLDMVRYILNEYESENKE